METSALDILLKDGTLAELYNLSTIDSTNDFLKTKISSPAFPILAVTDHQTRGKGRRGRVWECPAGENIAMSYLYRPSKNVQILSSVTLLSAIAIVDALKKLYQLPAKIKWPNDVIIGTKKVCGILAEMVSMGSENYVIIGIGINMNTKEFPDELKEKGTSVYQALHKETEIPLEPMTVEVTKALKSLIERLDTCSNLSFIKEYYNSLLITKGCPVNLSTDNIPFPDNPYLCLGIDANGDLLVEDKEHSIHTVSTGEVSVRGLLGYV